MKKIVSILMCVALLAVSALSFAGCSKNMKELKYDVVMITDGGTVADGSYNESAWNGVKDYAENAGVTYRYYQPSVEEGKSVTVETAQTYIELAVNAGAQYIVLPTEAYEVAVFETAGQYPDVNFILVDGTPHAEGDNISAVLNNVMCISFNSLQSGFLAGYSAVLGGNTKLGYIGSVYSKTSGNYGAGFVQGAAFAADQLAVPVTLDYADYDSPLLDYDYSFTVTANYIKIEDAKKECHKVHVVNGKGSGTYMQGENVAIVADPAPEGQVFDHWDYKSDTEGIKDKKVNVSSPKKPEINLIIEECDCTLTAVYKDAESTTYPVTVMNENHSAVYSEQFVQAGGSCNVKAPVAEQGMVFSHWEMNTNAEGVIDDINAKDTWVHLVDGVENITLTPVYEVSKNPTYTVNVVTGEGGNGDSFGSGSYVTGDSVTLEAAVPQEGYVFSHWSNADSNGYATGILIQNEYFPYTSFEMVNRVQAIAEDMYDEGVSIIFAGGNSECNVVADATWNYSYDKLGIGAENWQNGWDHYFTTMMRDYGSAVKACLEEFKGGFTYVGDCSNNGIYSTTVDKEYQQQYDEVYKALADGKIHTVQVAPGADVRLSYTSNCLSLDYWIV